MSAAVCQRWRDRRDSYRPADEPFDPRAHEVATIADDTTARAFVERHHYSGSYPAARRRFGLYERAGRLVGVAVFSVPVRPEVLRPLPGPASTGLELGRFVLLDEVRANAETWFLARCLASLGREGFAGVVSFSDPMARKTADGHTVFGGHVGTIYQASNAVYLGRAHADTVHLMPDGTVFPRRSLAKIRARDRGWRPAVERLVAAGARPLEGDVEAWLADALARVTRRVRHPGNHKYVFALDRGARRAMPASLPYPKLGALRGAA